MPRNLEFKARVENLDLTEKVFRGNGAEFKGILRQKDTYFNVGNGRLKLRETEGVGAELVYYQRNESSASGMESNYSIVRTSDPTLKDVLVKSLGIRTVVEKERRFLKLKNARIHLDRVQGLGTFLEFEVVSGETTSGVADDSSDAALLEKLKLLAAPFVTEEINESYSDLMLRPSPAAK